MPRQWTVLWWGSVVLGQSEYRVIGAIRPLDDHVVSRHLRHATHALRRSPAQRRTGIRKSEPFLPLTGWNELGICHERPTTYTYRSLGQLEVMKSFLTRPKRKSSPEPPGDSADEEPTEVKLALLSSLHPQLDQDVLLDILLAHNGSVSQASAALQTTRPKAKGNGVIGSQQSLKQYTIPSPSGNGSSPRKKLKSKKGSTLHLYDPEDVAEHTPCTIIHNFLHPEVANDLLKELLEEATSFEKITFKLFENVVASPHTSSFYVESYNEMQSQRTDYHYNGARLTVSVGAT